MPSIPLLVRLLPTQRLFLLLFGATLGFLLISWEFAVSLGMFALSALYLWVWDPRLGRLRWRYTWAEALAPWRRDASWFWVTMPFVLVLLTAFYSGDVGGTMSRLQLKVPFLVLTLAFSGLPLGGRRTAYLMHYLLLLLVVLTALPVLIAYLQDMDAYHRALQEGRSLATPSNHIRFSMAAALAACAGVILVRDRFYWRWPAERWLIGALVLFLLGFLHLLAVRTGLLALYAGLALLLGRRILQQRQWLAGALLGLLLLALPALAYRTMPAFRAKIDYMIWDIQQYRAGAVLENSDSNRLVSMRMAWDIFREHPWLGLGIGDLKGEMHARYAREAPHLKPLIPHNQWLYMLAGSGLLGGALFVAGFFSPLFLRRRYRDEFLLLLYALFFLSYWTEPVIENNFGISLWLLFLLPALHRPQASVSSP